jgi:hypothetical protein
LKERVAMRSRRAVRLSALVSGMVSSFSIVTVRGVAPLSPDCV